MLVLENNSLTGPLPSAWKSLGSLRGLLVANNSLTGSLPGDWSSLSELQQADLSNDALRGPVPDTWRSLSNLEILYLWSNNLMGKLPDSWNALRRLKWLIMWNNSIGGTLPSSLSTLNRLEVLVLSQNGLSGVLPGNWSRLSALQKLDLTNNSLSNTLPKEWSTLGQLQELVLYGNMLNGTLPKDWGQMPRLGHVDLGNNTFDGGLPTEWGTLTNLKWLGLYDNNLSGALPSSWSGMRALTWLMLYNNSLNGSLPSSWSGLRQLSKLGLSHNRLTGTLPSEWGSWSQLQWMWLSDNRLKGPLPSNWSQLRSLQTLLLYNNSLSGTLPAAWSGLSNLQMLYVSNNTLNGTLPDNWSSLGRLQQLSLRKNQLKGALPSSWGFMTSLQDLFLDNNSLTGTIPPFIFGASNLTFVTLNNNHLTGTLPRVAVFPSLMDMSNNDLQGELPETVRNSVLLVLSNQTFGISGSLPNYTSGDAENLRVFSIGGNDNLRGPVPQGWYTRTTFSKVQVLDVGQLLYKDAATPWWRKQFCTSEKLFHDEDSTGQIAHGIENIIPMLKSGITLDFSDGSHSRHVVLHLTNVGPILERVPTKSVDTVRRLCKNNDWQEVLGGLWGPVLALVVAAYLFRVPLARKWHKYVVNVGPWGPVADMGCAVSASLYWYDFYTDIVMMRFLQYNLPINGHQRWSFWVMLALFLLSFVVAAVVLCLCDFRMARAQLDLLAAVLPRRIVALVTDARDKALKLKIFSTLVQYRLVKYSFGFVGVLLLTPVLDTMGFLLLVLRDKAAHVMNLHLKDVEIESYTHMRDVVKVLSSTVPLAVIISVIYATGNTPDAGMALTQKLVVAQLLSAALLILSVWCSVLYKSVTSAQDPGIWKHVQRVLQGKPLPPGNLVCLCSTLDGEKQYVLWQAILTQVARVVLLVAPIAAAIALEVAKDQGSG